MTITWRNERGGCVTRVTLAVIRLCRVALDAVAVARARGCARHAWLRVFAAPVRWCLGVEAASFGVALSRSDARKATPEYVQLDACCREVQRGLRRREDVGSQAARSVRERSGVCIGVTHGGD